ncbi:MAG: hypothetical protein PUF48_03240 [Oscillospiraceae bacterium]|nr:hypothetical protein [Oscillospiraceae bacterium]
MKKLLAILCAVALVFCSLFTGVLVSAEEATLTQIKPSAIGAQGKFCVGDVWANINQPFLNASFKAKVDVSIATGAHDIRFGNPWQNYWVGLQINFNNNKITATNEFGWDTSGILLDNFDTTQPFDIEITSVAVDNEGDGQFNDVKFSVFANGISAGSATVNNIAESHCPYLNIVMPFNVMLWDTDYAINPALVASDVEAVDTITLADFSNFKPGAHYPNSEAWYELEDYGFGTKTIFNNVFEADVLFDRDGFIKYPMFQQNEAAILLSTDGKNLILSDAGTGLVPSDESGRLATIPAEDFGYDVFVGKTFNYKVAFTLVNNDNEILIDENGVILDEDLKNDVKMSYYINDKCVYSRILNGSVGGDGLGTAITNEEGEIVDYEYTLVNGKNLFSDARGEANFFAANNGIFNLPEEKLPVLNEVTFADLTDLNGAPIEYKAYDGWCFTNLFPAKDTTLNTDVYMANNGSIFNLDYAEIGLYDGRVVFNNLDDRGYDVNITPEDVSYLNKQFNLKITTQYIDLDGEGIPNDIKLGVFVDGKGKFIYIEEGVVDYYKRPFGIVPGTEIREPDYVPSGLQQVTIADNNVAAGNYDLSSPGASINWNNKTYTYSLVGSRLEMDMSIANADHDFDFTYGFGAGENEWLGIKTSFKAGKVSLNHGDGLFMDQTETHVHADLPAAGTRFKFEITVEKADADLNNDGVYNDLRFGFFIDGKHIGKGFAHFTSNFGAKNDEMKESPSGIRFYANAPSNITLYEPASRSENFNWDEFEEVTVEDFGIESGTYVTKYPIVFNSGLTKASGYSLNGKVFKTKFKFAEGDDAVRLTLMGYDGSWSVFIGANGYLGITIYSDESQHKRHSVHALPDFRTGEDMDIAVTYKYAYGSMQIGVWINGKLQNNRFYNLCGYDMSGLFNAIGVYSNVGTANVIGEQNPVYIKENTSDDNSFTITPVEGKTLTVNGAAVNAETTYTAIGEYVVNTTASTGAYDFTGTKTFVIFKDKDFNGDNAVDILDFIIAKKNAANTRPLSGAVALAAAGKTDAADLITPEELIAIKRAVLFG